MKTMSTYLDYNATAPVYPEVVEMMKDVLAMPANPSSVHAFGRAAKKYMEDGRKAIADTVSVFGDEVIFTASGSEANNMALFGTGRKKILVSATEHSSVLKVRKDSEHIPVSKDGVIDLAALDNMLATGELALVSVMLANNETGVIQPIAEVSAICKKYDALLHCDAVQALGKMPFDFGSLGCDMMTLSGHKCGGPVGAAVLVARRYLPVAPLIIGGEQEMNRRAGTENVAAIAGFGVAVRKIDFTHMEKLRGWMATMEDEMLACGATIFGRSARRLPNATRVAMPGVKGDVQLIDFDLKGFAVSAGSACSAGRIEPSHVLAAMGASPEIAICAIRVSGGWGTTENEIKSFTETWKQLAHRLAAA